MRNNNFKRGESSFERKKQPQRAGKGRQEGREPGREAAASQKQVQSRIEYINFKQDAEFNIDRLDLIFQKQPREIQEKLMKLLISYNAILQYVRLRQTQNKDTDLFEVDLLLPFLSEHDKKDFVRQFLEIRRGKGRDASQDQPIQSPLADDRREPSSHSNSNSFNQSKEIRKFSFNNNIKFASEFEEEVHREEENRLSQSQHSQQIEQEDHRNSLLQNNQHEHNPRDNTHSTSNHALVSLQNKGLNLRKIEESISQRLKNAINIINRRKGREERNKENQNSKSILISDEDVKKEDSIIQKLAESNQFNESQRYSEDKSSFYIKEDVGETEEPSEERLFARNHIEELNLNTNYHSEKFGEVIMEQMEEEDYEPLFASKERKAKANDKVTSFEDYTRNYTTLKQDKAAANPKNTNNRTNQRARQENQVSLPRNYFSSKEKQHHKKSNTSFEAHKPEKTAEGQLAKQQAGSKEKVRSRQSSSHSRSISTKKESPSKESLEIKQHLSDFFSQHQQHLQSLYSEIRSKISGQPKPASSQKGRQAWQKPATASQEEFYILVLDDLEQQDSQSQSIGEFPHSRQFRSEMMRQYKREILRASKNLSSEELIRYFKYLHANAKKLYLKYLRSRR